MAQPTAASPRTNPSHAMLHSEHHNVKAFGAVGNGIADDRVAIQATIDAASAAASSGGSGQVFFPAGDYHVGNTLTLDGNNVTLKGPAPRGLGGAANDTPGAAIGGNMSAPLIQRNQFDTKHIVIEDLVLYIDGATGTVASLAGLSPGSGFYRCDITGHIGVDFVSNCFNAGVYNSSVRRNSIGTLSTSIGISLTNHSHVQNVDINGFGVGVYSGGGIGSNILGGRIEVCQTGVSLGPFGARGILVSGISFEGNDTAILLRGGATQVTGCSILGHNGAPSGNSIYGIDVDGAIAVVVGVDERGTHTGAFVRVSAAARDMVFIGSGGPTAWNLASTADITVLNCTPQADIIRVPVVARASLPAAAAAEDGRLIIDDNGAGDRNLMLYAGGQRFRIDGGANV